MSMSDNQRELIGGNKPPVDYAKTEQERLSAEYVGYTNTLTDLAAKAARFDSEIPDDENADDQALKIGSIIKSFRDLDKRIEETRVVEGEPHLRRKNACDAFFKGLRSIIQPEDKKDRRLKPGWIDRLQDRINAHQNRKEAKERHRLELERLERERVARIAQEKADREAADARRLLIEAQERQASADRARNEITRAEKQRLADEAAKAADAATASTKASEVAAATAAEESTDARIATLAKPQDIVRTRGVTEHGAGVTLTTAKEPYCFVIDRKKLDPAKLFPFFNDGEVEKALRGYAKSTHYDEAMEGAEIGWGRKGITR